MQNLKTPNTEKPWKLIIGTFTKYAVLWLILLILLALGEVIFYLISHSTDNGAVGLITQSIIKTIHFWTVAVLLGFVFYAALYIIKPKIARIFISVIICLFLALQTALIFYFNSSLSLLGADLFGYSIDDILLTVGASGQVTLGSIVVLLSVIGLSIFSLIKVSQTKSAPLSIGFAVLIISLIVVSVSGLSFESRKASYSEFANNMVTHKLGYFSASILKYFRKEELSDNLATASEPDAKSDVTYIDEEYPFLRKRTTNNVLGGYFDSRETPPDIVFVIVEGLGMAYSNKDAYLGSFTPYLDSLANKGLYWKNFLSNGGRTFAILPSLFGSLPFGQSGFLEIEGDTPNHYSLFNILKDNGYSTSFFYGGDATFDNMDSYLKYNDVDVVFDETNFAASDQKLPEYKGFSWGYDDFQLYDKVQNHLENFNDRPSFTVILTVASHSPFLINEQDEYLQIFEDRLEELNLSEEVKESRRNYKNQFATILYADAALKSFIENYKANEKFENTIFVITGDHRIPEIPMSTKIDRYHVPLLVYSPMLKKSETFSAISSHFDIAPSLLSYLEKIHELKVPEVTTELGLGVDTNISFQGNKRIPLMQTKTNLIDFISGEYHLNGDQVFQLIDNMGEIPIEDETIKNRLMLEFQDFRIRNEAFLKSKRLLADSLYFSFYED